MTEDERRIPASFYEPLPPSKPERPTGAWVFAGIVMAVFALTVAGLVWSEVGEARKAAAERKRVERAEADLRRSMERPADSVSVAPNPDGTKRWASPAPDGDSLAFHLTLARGWNARYVGSRAGEEFVDSILTKPHDTEFAVVTIVRLDTYRDISTEEFAQGLRLGAEADGDQRITSEYLETSIDDEPAYYFDGTAESDDGEALRTRLLVYRHGSETFVVSFASAAGAWGRNLKEFQRLLRSWGYG